MLTRFMIAERFVHSAAFEFKGISPQNENVIIFEHSNVQNNSTDFYRMDKYIF